MSRLSRWSTALRSIERPSRYVGGEFGLPPAPRGEVRLRVALGFPDTYDVGMSHLGYRLLHASLAEQRDLQVERVFLPYPDMQRALQDQGLALASLESNSPLAEFHLLGLSVQYELAFPGVLRLLDLAQIPRRTQQRAADEGRWPLVLVGGSASCNPEPLAPFVDAFFLGEADQALAEIVDCLARHRQAPRAEALAALARVPGIYVPELVRVEHDAGGLGLRVEALPPAVLPVQRRYVEDLDALPLPEHHLVPTCGLVHDRVTIEIQRGCSQGCRFCQAGFVSRPTRQRSAGRVLQEARRLLAQTGYQDLALLSLSAGDHPCLQQMLSALIEEHGPRRVAVSLPSLRTETLDPVVAQQISKVRRTTFTLAPEAATDRLRAVINKQNTEDDLLRAVDVVVQAGYSRLKLYFMIGLPTETEQDVLAIARLAQRVEQRARQRRRSAGLSISVSPFVPKPQTPLQWEPAPDVETIRERLRLLQGQLPRRIKLKWHDPGQSLAEAYLARGDRRLAAVLDRLVDRDHLGLDSWTEHFDLRRWQRALEAAAAEGEIPSPGLYLGARDPRQTLPWEHLDVGLERAYLLDQRRAALAGETRPDCTDGTCDDCGVCPAEPLHALAPEPPSAEETRAPPPAEEPAAPPMLVRIWFHKRGPARFVGHLEMAGVFERAARRAGLPLAFSRGFHPKARLRFSPALPLGAESLCEFLELGLVQPLSPDEVGHRLADQLPPGFELQSWEPAVPRDLLARIEGVRWRLEPPALIPPEQLEAARQRLAQGPLWQDRGKGRRRDLARLVLELQAGEGRTLEVRCRFDSGGTARPDEILVGLLHLGPAEVQRTAVTRLGWALAQDC